MATWFGIKLSQLKDDPNWKENGAKLVERMERVAAGNGGNIESVVLRSPRQSEAPSPVADEAPVVAPAVEDGDGKLIDMALNSMFEADSEDASGMMALPQTSLQRSEEDWEPLPAEPFKKNESEEAVRREVVNPEVQQELLRELQ